MNSIPHLTQVKSCAMYKKSKPSSSFQTPCSLLSVRKDKRTQRDGRHGHDKRNHGVLVAAKHIHSFTLAARRRGRRSSSAISRAICSVRRIGATCSRLLGSGSVFSGEQTQVHILQQLECCVLGAALTEIFNHHSVDRDVQQVGTHTTLM